MNVLRSLQHRPFALLWSGQTISRLGDSLYRIALAWWVLEKTGSASAMGTVLILSQIPMLLFLLVGGVIVDRLPRLRIMFLADLLCGLLVSTIALLSFRGMLEIWHIYIASVLFGLVEAFFFPAYQAVVPQITPAEHLQSANSLNGLSQRVTGIIGPALGAALVAAGGTSLAFALDALSFLISTVCVFIIFRTGETALAQPERKAAGSFRESVLSGWADLREGFEAVIRVPWIWISIMVFGFFNILHASPRAVALPFFIKDDLGADVTLLGTLGSASSLGFVVGMLWLGQYRRLHHRGPIAYLSSMLLGVVLLLFGFKLPIPVLIGGVFVEGLCLAVFSLIWTHTLQEMVPGEKLGRVYSIDALGSFVLLPIGIALAGWATDVVGAPTVFLVGGVGTIILALLPLLHPAIRNLD